MLPRSATVGVEPPSAAWEAAASTAMLVAHVEQWAVARVRSATSLAQELIGYAGAELELTVQVQGMLHLVVRVFDDLAILTTYQARGKMLPIGPPLDLALPPRLHAQTQDMQFGLTQETPQAKEQPIIVLAWGIDPLGIYTCCLSL